jgi:hypothetical protein
LARRAGASEEAEQAALFDWIALYRNRKDCAGLSYVFHPPNGGWRHRATAARLKRMGASAGVPDVLVLYPSCGYNGLAGEMKAGRNRLTSGQEAWLDRLSEVGWMVDVWHSWPQAAKAIAQYLGLPADVQAAIPDLPSGAGAPGRFA